MTATAFSGGPVARTTGSTSAGGTAGSSVAAGVSGDLQHLTITVNAYDPTFGGAGFILESSLGAVGQ